MKIFVSWSGERSRQIALVLRDWIPSTLPYAEPWVSSEDIAKGARWIVELGSELEAARFGLICLVPGNLREPWLNFEAGAMARSMEAGRVSPVLVGLDREEVQGPLAQFQSTVFEKEDVRKLVHSINKVSPAPLPPDRVDRTFELCWPGLAKELEPLAGREEPPEPASASEPRNDTLPPEQTKILVRLANDPQGYPEATEIAHAIGQNLTRAQYHLDRLRDRGLIDHVLGFGDPPTYYLTDAGRAYVVERDLV